jgi:hypothetical protein
MADGRVRPVESAGADILKAALAASHVVKRLQPEQAGALKLARRFGPALVCVRYRQDERGTHRYTTVEIVVAQGPIQRSRRDREIVNVFIDYDDGKTQAAARAHGARWDGRARVCRMPRHVARRLRLLSRIREVPIGQ